MRIEVRLPRIEPETYDVPEQCPYEKCDGKHHKPHGIRAEEKAIRDLRHRGVHGYRRRYLTCGRRFRIYPRGVSSAQQSKRLKAITVLLYVLGLSYGAVSDFTSALGCVVSKTTVYYNVQEAGEKARKHQRRTVKRGGKRPVVGADGTYVKIKGEQVGIEVVVDDESGELLGLDIVVSENSEDILDVIKDVAEEVDADVVVSDDHGAYKEAAIKLGLDQQICRSHVKRNVDEVVESIQEQLKKKEPKPTGFRRQGIAATMIEMSAERARMQGAYQLRAWSSQDKVEAIPMWKALGFGLCPTATYPRGEKVEGYFDQDSGIEHVSGELRLLGRLTGLRGRGGGPHNRRGGSRQPLGA